MLQSGAAVLHLPCMVERMPCEAACAVARSPAALSRRLARAVCTDNAEQRCTDSLNPCAVVDGRLPDTDAHLARVSLLGAENMREHLVAVTTPAARAFAKLR